jgi:hypothetical protein
MYQEPISIESFTELYHEVKILKRVLKVLAPETLDLVRAKVEQEELAEYEERQVVR